MVTRVTLPQLSWCCEERESPFNYTRWMWAKNILSYTIFEEKGRSFEMLALFCFFFWLVSYPLFANTLFT